MRIGVFTPLLSQLSLEDALKKLKSNGVDTVELGTGNYPGDAHCKLSMLDSGTELKEFKKKLDDYGFSISALSCHGNPLHPDPEHAKHDAEVSRKTILLAEKLGVPVVVDFSGCPGDSPGSQLAQLGDLPLAAGLPGNSEVAVGRSGHAVLDEARQIRRRSRREDRHRDAPGLRGLQPGDACCKLRAIAGPTVGCNYDPSHMFWQGIDPIAAIRVLGDAIFHVHAKDTQIYARNLPLTGVLDTKTYTDERNRAWIFRTCGYGHGEEWWREFVSTLRMFGYDYVLSIEHEDSLLSPEEGLTQSGCIPERDRHEGAARRGVVGVAISYQLSAFRLPGGNIADSDGCKLPPARCAVVVAVVAVDPCAGNVNAVVARRDYPRAVDPDVGNAVPGIVTGGPHITRARWRRRGYDDRRRRRNSHKHMYPGVANARGQHGRHGAGDQSITKHK